MENRTRTRTRTRRPLGPSSIWKQLTRRRHYPIVPVNENPNDLDPNDIDIDIDDEPTQHHTDNDTKPKITISKVLRLLAEAPNPTTYYKLLDKNFQKLYYANLKTPIALPLLPTEPDTHTPHGGKKKRKTRRRRKTKTHKNKHKK